MKFTLSWLRDHLETTADLTDLTEALTALGLELESINDPETALAAFTVGEVLAVDAHPDADRLKLCRTMTRAGEIQIVCGAPNVRSGMKVAFASLGTSIPGTGMIVKKSMIRGVESNGMLCSAHELGLGADHEGLIALPDEAPIGASVAVWLDVKDPVIDIGVTPNRADCLGVRGIARDLAAKGLGRLKPLDSTPVPGGFTSPFPIRIDLPIGREADCPLFVGRYFRHVTNGPSPDWMQARLRAIGLRPISALVDITNYMTFDLGRPLHVFDAAMVQGGIVVRPGHCGESVLALNGKNYALDESITCVCDEAGVLGLGGVIGGEASGCTFTTRDLLLEVALFDPHRTAMTGRRLGIQSEARYRFERGLDPDFVHTGMEIATKLILELCGGEASQPVIAGRVPNWRRSLILPTDRVARLGGLAVPVREQIRSLSALGFMPEIISEVSEIESALPESTVPESAVPESEVPELSGTPSETVIRVSPPSWRADIAGTADLVEEVLRIVGYDQIPSLTLPGLNAVTRPNRSQLQTRVSTIRRVLAGEGFAEAITYSFMRSDLTGLFGASPAPESQSEFHKIPKSESILGDPALRLLNPISRDLDAMRPSLLPNLIAAAGRNLDRGQGMIRLFEIGPQFSGSNPQDQHLAIGCVLAGEAVPRHWRSMARIVDAYDAKQAALQALAAMGVQTTRLHLASGAPSWYHPGLSGILRLDPRKPLAWFGALHPLVLRAMGIEMPMMGCEIFPQALPFCKNQNYQDPSGFDCVAVAAVTP